MFPVGVMLSAITYIINQYVCSRWSSSFYSQLPSRNRVEDTYRVGFPSVVPVGRGDSRRQTPESETPSFPAPTPPFLSLGRIFRCSRETLRQRTGALRGGSLVGVVGQDLVLAGAAVRALPPDGTDSLVGLPADAGLTARYAFQSIDDHVSEEALRPVNTADSCNRFAPFDRQSVAERPGPGTDERTTLHHKNKVPGTDTEKGQAEVESGYLNPSDDTDSVSAFNPFVSTGAAGALSSS